MHLPHSPYRQNGSFPIAPTVTPSKGLLSDIAKRLLKGTEITKQIFKFFFDSNTLIQKQVAVRMNDNDLLNFIGELQLKCGQKNKDVSDIIMNTFEEFREGLLTREECINLVFIALRDFPKLSARFAKICEAVPMHQTRYGSIVHEPFINSVIEFELWPNSLTNLLNSARKALLNEITMNDFFYDIERIKNTSGPFWLLWDLFQEILPNSMFLQSIFDGCVSKETIPDHINLDIKPSEFDKDRSLLTYNSVIDSDLVCCYPNDYRYVPFQIGILKRGSYGLLSRKKVDLKCSGRTLQDYAVLNDRWAVNATGAEPCFKPSAKNQYEEKLFDVENERIEMDVRLERIKSTNSRIKNLILKIQDSQNPKDFFDPETFPKDVFSSLDILTLKELYLEPKSPYDRNQNKIQKLYEQIVNFPIETLKIISERIDAKISTTQEMRKNKEKEYYEISRRNYPRSLEVRNIEKNPFQTNQIEIITDESDVLKLTNNGVHYTIDILSQTYKHMTYKEQSFNDIMELIYLFFKIKVPEPKESNVKKCYPSFHESDIQDDKTLFFTRDMVRIIKSFYKIACTLTNIQSTEDQPQQEIIESNNQQMSGLSLASSIGFVGNDSQLNSKEDSLKESLPFYFAGSRNNVNLESLFETQSNLPYQSLDSLKKAVCSFIKNSASSIEDSFSKELFEKLKSYTSPDYFLSTLAFVSGRPYYSVCLDFQDEIIEIKFQKKLPRLSFLRNNYSVLPVNLKEGPALISSQEIEKLQNECLVNHIKKSKKVLTQRDSIRNLEFRLGQKNIQFKKSTINYIKRDM